MVVLTNYFYKLALVAGSQVHLSGELVNLTRWLMVGDANHQPLVDANHQPVVDANHQPLVDANKGRKDPSLCDSYSIGAGDNSSIVVTRNTKEAVAHIIPVTAADQIKQ